MLSNLKLTMGLPSRFAYQKLKILGIVLLFSIEIFGQYTFRVFDDSNNPLIGVEAYSQDLTISAISDLEGYITIDDSDIEKAFTINYLGFQEIQTFIRRLKEDGSVIRLKPSQILIEEILLVGRNEMSKEALPYHIETINQDKISSTNPQSAADALAHHGNLYIQKSQMGGGSPVIRGFEANKVLLVLDGIRMNNAIYRNGHLQNAVTVDQAMLEKVEVIFGPNSLTYGSDALGGVVHFKSRLPKLKFTDGEGFNSFGNYNLRYSTANQEKTAHIDYNIGGRKLASLTSLSFSKFSDLRSGNRRSNTYPEFGKRIEYIETINGEDRIVTNDNPNIQVGTGYSQFDVLQKVLYQPDNYFQLVANFQFSTSSDVPRYDQLIDREDGVLRFAEWNYGPQQRVLASVKFKFLMPTPFYDKAIFITAIQRIQEDRISRRVGRINRSSQLENVTVQSFTADFTKKITDRHEIFYGGNFQQDFVRSKAIDEDILTGEINTNVLTRYPSGGSEMMSFGIYGQYHWSTADDLGHLNVGLRASGTKLNINYLDTDPVEWPENFIEGINSSNNSVIWSAGWSQRYKQGWNWRALVSTAFRSPNIDDMAKVRIKGDEVTFPNADLSPEKSFNAEYTVGKTFGQQQGQVSVTAFYTDLKDAIVREEFIDNTGSSLFVSGQDSFNIFANVNADRARIGGLSLTADYPISKSLIIETNLNWTKGRVIDEFTGNRPLSHIPPVYGKFAVLYEKKNYSMRSVIRFNGKKPLDEYGGSADNPEYATPEGALGWTTLNIYGNYELTDRMTLSFGIENILDKHYRQFASGVSASGINGIMSVKGKF